VIAYIRIALICGCLVAAQASATAGEPRTAIAPISTPPSVSPDLTGVFIASVSQAAANAGFETVPANEIDMKVVERPDFLQCKAGSCLAAEAQYLGVSRLILPRLELHGGGLQVSLALYDATKNKVVAEESDQCGACTADKLRAFLLDEASRLSKDLQSGAEHDVRVTLAPPTPPIAPAPLPPVEQRRRTSLLGVLKWVALGSGLVAIAVGAGIWSLDGRGTCSLQAPAVQCPQLYDTMPVGASLVGLGGALLATSVVLIIVDRPRVKNVSLAPTAGGATLLWNGNF
jgi:hypothetical protein